MASRDELRFIRAARAGDAAAQLALGRLYLAGSTGLPCSLPTALHWFGRAAQQGSAEARALIAAHAGVDTGPAPRPPAVTAPPPPPDAVLGAAWAARQWGLYLQRALPLARALAQDCGRTGAARLAPAEATLLSRCARALAAGPSAHQVGAAELMRFLELAAAAQDRHARMALGLRCARMRADGSRTGGAGAVNFKKAIRWLAMAGEQGLAEAWYALSRIYGKPEFSQRNVVDAQRYLERAAEMGHRDAQFECGGIAWRARRENEANDVRAAYWMQQAARAGCAAAGVALGKIAPRPCGPAHRATGTVALRAGAAVSHPLLAARLELAAAFNLTRAEALLLDVRQADHGHCLVVDIRASYGRSKRRLVLVETVQQRHALDRIGRLFEDVDCGPDGPEGNYRQRLYRLKTLALAAGVQYGLAA